MAIPSFIPRNIQHEIKAIIKATAQLQKQWPEFLFMGTDKANSIYTFYPYLFLPVFPLLKPKDIRPLALAGRLFSSSVIASDNILDRSAPKESLGFKLMQTQAAQFEAYHILHDIFPPTAVFWDRFREYLSDFSRAYLLEQSFAPKGRSWQEFSEDTALTIISGKTGIAKATIAGLAELAQDESQFRPLIESVENFYIACQMFDDLTDWKEDLKTQIPSLLLCRVVKEHPSELGEEVTEEYMNRISREIFYSEHASFVLGKALRAVDQASSLLSAFPDLLWHQILKDMKSKYEILAEDLKKIINENILRMQAQPRFHLKLPETEDPWKRITLKSLTFICKQWELGFGEVRHIMRFPYSLGHTAKQEYQHGDTFQRAIIAGILCDVNELVESQLNPIITYESNYLLSKQCSDSTGGWSYFPDLPELPPDADDLAQIMQVFIKRGHLDLLKDHCETPLNVLLNDNMHDDGSFETWIIPKENRSSDQERQIKWAKNAWGTGPDCEVIANLLYSLEMYDADRFADTIQKGIDFIEASQQENGSWISTWYHGPFYGIYVCLRLLTKARPNSFAIQSGIEFLLRTQHPDGGWGLSDQSDALSTALALLGMSTIRTENVPAMNNSYSGFSQWADDFGFAGIDDQERVQAALEYLTESMDEEKSWKGADFIRMDIASAKGDVQNILSYGGRTITTAYVLNTAQIWHKILEVVGE